MTRPDDPMEWLVFDALEAAKIPFEMGYRTAARLDFYLPGADVHIEVKRFYSPRIAGQMARVENVIALQGEKAVRLFAQMMRDISPDE